jgi:hypothetical protein
VALRDVAAAREAHRCHAAAQAQRPQSDEIDGWQLADVLRRDAVERSVFKSPQSFTALRQAARGYVAVQSDLVRAKCRLNALYRSRGLIPSAEIYDEAERGPWLKKLPASHQPLAELLGEQLEGLIQAHQTAEAWLLKEAKRAPVARRLATVPGIGPMRVVVVGPLWPRMALPDSGGHQRRLGRSHDGRQASLRHRAAKPSAKLSVRNASPWEAMSRSSAGPISTPPG